MTRPWRWLALAAALFVTVGAGAATAQTIIVRSAPAGAAVEVLFDGSRLVTGKADAAGDATLPVTLQLTKGNWEVAARVYVDVCGTLFRIGLVDRLSLSPTPSDGCERRDVQGLFVLKSATSLLVDVGSNRASVWLRQGPVPKEWMAQQGEGPERPVGPRRLAPKGFVVFGGAAWTIFRTGTSPNCGNVSDCKPENSVLGYTAGVSLWLTRFLAVEGSYLKPSTLFVTGSGTNYRFQSSLETQLINAVGKVGLPIGIVRIYGMGGMNYHRSLRTTYQVNDPHTITVDDVPTTIPGNSQTWAMATEGFGWLFGGGGEVWAGKRFALYGEFSYNQVKGNGLNSTPGTIDDRLTYFGGGARVKLGK